MNLKPPFLIAIIFLFFPSLIFSQHTFSSFHKTDGFSITPKMGLASLTGELGDIWTVNPNLGFCVEKGISEKINLGLEIIGGNLSGSDKDIYSSRFETDFIQIQTLAFLNLSRFSKSVKSHNFEVKVFTGVGMIFFHTDVFDLKSGNFLRTTADGTTYHTQIFQQYIKSLF